MVILTTGPFLVKRNRPHQVVDNKRKTAAQSTCEGARREENDGLSVGPRSHESNNRGQQQITLLLRNANMNTPRAPFTTGKSSNVGSDLSFPRVTAFRVSLYYVL